MKIRHCDPFKVLSPYLRCQAQTSVPQTPNNLKTLTPHSSDFSFLFRKYQDCYLESQGPSELKNSRGAILRLTDFPTSFSRLFHRKQWAKPGE